MADRTPEQGDNDQAEDAFDLIPLIERAEAAVENAYCPYSHFPVGAAVLMANDQGEREVFSGANVENASFGLTNCAERSALFAGVSWGFRHLLAVVVYTPTPEPTTPCGACRQALNEFGPEAEIFCCCDGPKSLKFRLAELLPGAFGPDNLA